MATGNMTSGRISLEPVEAELPAVLARETGLSRAALLREAVDDLLAKYLSLAAQRSK